MNFVVDCKSKDCGYIRRDALTLAYYRDVNVYPILSHDEERKLLVRAKSKNPAISKPARDKLVECNQRFIISVARRWGRGDNFMDIVNEANLGLIHAIDSYDLKMKCRFITYAVWWIRKYINDYVTLKERPVIPPNAIKLHVYLPKARMEFFNEHERYPSLSELREILRNKYNVSVKCTKDLETLTLSSIDNSYYEPDESIYDSDIIQYENVTSSNNIVEDMNKEDAIKTVAAFLGILDEKERTVVEKYYGIGCEGMSIPRIANELGYTTERVRQIHRLALKKMKGKSKLINKL